MTFDTGHGAYLSMLMLDHYNKCVVLPLCVGWPCVTQVMSSFAGHHTNNQGRAACVTETAIL